MCSVGQLNMVFILFHPAAQWLAFEILDLCEEHGVHGPRDDATQHLHVERPVGVQDGLDRYPTHYHEDQEHAHKHDEVIAYLKR